MKELNWDWSQIATVLIWKLAPHGFVLLLEDMISLPRERVLLDDRRPDRIVLSFINLPAAQRLMAAERGEQRATMTELQGRWHKIAVVSLWHFARRHQLGKEDSLTLTEYDRASLPSHLQLMASGHAQGLEWQFLPNAQAKKIADWDRDNEGHLILERLQ